MSIVYMRLEFPDTYSEVIADDTERTELTIENIVATALLEVFDTVVVDNITIQHSHQSQNEK